MEPRNTGDIVKVIRTILTSAKNGLLIQEINDDYEQMEGKQIPFKAHGYNTLEDLLRDTNYFAFIESKQGIRVMSKPSKDAYVNRSAPNSPSKGKKKGNMIPPQRALRTTTENHWNGTAYSQAYTQMPNRSVKKGFMSPEKTVYSNGGTYRAIVKHSNMKQVPKDETPNHPANEASHWNNSVGQSRPFPMRNQSNQQNNIWMNRNNPSADRILKKPHEYSKPNDVAPSTKSSVQSRLAIQKTISADIVDYVQTQQPMQPTHEMPDTSSEYLNGSFTQQMNSMKLENIEQLPYAEAISVYCTKMGYSEPQYSFSKTKARKFTCKVTVGPAIYASYPNEFNTQIEAQNEAARIAYESINDGILREKYPTCMDSAAEIANKIFECITENGVFLKFIPQLFQEKYDATLPEGWMSIIEDSPQMFSIAKDALMDRVYPNIPNQKSQNGVAEQKTNELEELVLPWYEKHWNIFVTSVSTTVDIWGRLIGPDFSAKLDSILDDAEIELVSGGSKTVCTNLSVGKYCFITNPDCYRVRIEKIDTTRNMALCFLIDYGDEEWWALNQIYEGDAKLFQLPAQAIRFSLFNLEDFAENPHAKQEVDEYLAGKTLIAEIKSSQTEYYAQCESSVDAKIKAVFYDTSSEEDVQLNKVILERICEKVEPPQLQRQKWNPVNVSHISDAGDIYVQLYNDKGNTVHNIKQLIHRLTQNGNNKQFVCVMKPAAANELYLIQDPDDLKWYRAAILPRRPIDTSVDGSVELCKYIDYGMTKCVPRENIYRLDVLSAALSKYPHQAIHVRLNDVTNYNPKIVARLHGLLCSGSPVLAQVAGGSSMIPMVNICKRLESNILCKINDTIRMEQEIESMNQPDLLYTEDTFTVPVGDNAYQAKDSLELRQYPDPPLDKYFNAIVVTAPSPSNFFVRPVVEEAGFKNMMVQLKSHCENSAQRINQSDIQVNQYYVGQLQDGYWYRVKIQTILPADSVAVFKCDFGDINFLSISALRPLTPEFRNIPQLAIPAKLHGIQPKNNDWNNEDSAYFQQITVQKQFAAAIKAIRKEPSSNQSYVLELVLIDVSTAKDVNVNEVLINKQHANRL